MDGGITILDVEDYSKYDMEELLLNGQKRNNFELNGALDLLVAYIWSNNLHLSNT